jgi:imidazolonepropionase-like amidohydrolase
MSRPSHFGSAGTHLGLSVAALCFALTSAVSASADTALVIDGARIVTGSGPAIENGRVVVIGDMIAAIGANAEIPSSATVLDGKGLTVYPGLIDAYCLAGVAAPASTAAPAAQPAPTAPARTAQDRPRQARAQRQALGTPAPLAWRKATDGFKTTSEALPALRANGYTAALFGVRGVLTPGEAVLMSLSPGETPAMVVQDRAAVYVNMMSRGQGAYPGTLMGAFAFLRQAFYDGIDARNRPPAKPDPRLEALGLAAEAKIPTFIAANSENEIRRAMRLGAEFKLRTIVLGGRDAGKMAPALAEAKVCVVLTEDWSPAVALSKAGVPFALGSNKLEMSAGEANDLRAKAKDLVAKGLPEETVLAALTRVPAELLGVGDRLGIVAAGRRAHLVITEGSLFHKDGKVRYVVVNGKKIDAEPVKTAGGPRPRRLLEDGVPFETITEDDADIHGHGDGDDR